jgi:hypothetical protein
VSCVIRQAAAVKHTPWGPPASATPVYCSFETFGMTWILVEVLWRAVALSDGLEKLQEKVKTSSMLYIKRAKKSRRAKCWEDAVDVWPQIQSILLPL